VNAVINPRVPYNAGNFLPCCRPISFSGMTLLHIVGYVTVKRILLLDTVTVIAEKASINNKLLPVCGTLKRISLILTSGDKERSK
jgi:hypothetical protein